MVTQVRSKVTGQSHQPARGQCHYINNLFWARSFRHSSWARLHNTELQGDSKSKGRLTKFSFPHHQGMTHFDRHFLISRASLHQDDTSQ